MITSFANKKIKEVQNLNKKAGAREESGFFTVEGIRMFRELPADRIKDIFVSESFHASCGEELKKKIDSVPGELVSDEVFMHLSDTRTPQGILAVVKQYSYTTEEILKISASPAAGEEKTHSLFLMLETIQDPGNLGTMMRAGEGAGLSGMILNEKTADIYNPKVIRSTMGSIFRVPFAYTDNLVKIMGEMKKAGIRIFAADLKGAVEYEKEDYTGPSAFLIGNEASGLSEAAADLADVRVKIPMRGEVESLNAAVAASILLFEAARQRRRGSSEKPESPGK